MLDNQLISNFIWLKCFSMQLVIPFIGEEAKCFLSHHSISVLEIKLFFKDLEIISLRGKSYLLVAVFRIRLLY